MSPSFPGRNALWLLPIVVAVCALMVLPAGAILGGGAFSPSPNHAAGTTQSALSTASSPERSSGGNSFTNPYSPASIASTLAQQSYPGRSYSPTTLSDFSSALSQLASKPSLSSHSALLNGLAQAVASGKASPSSIYLPNLGLLGNPVSSPGQVVSPGYVGQPAPMGLGDFGLGASGPYSYNTSSFVGSLVLNSSQATFPGAYYFVTPSTNTYGSYADPYRYGIQLNTVLSNVSIPGTNTGSFWTQNVVTWDNYTDTLQFEDNVWNFSSPSGLLEPNTIESGNGTYVQPSYYYDYGPAYQLTPPITLNLYNNATVRDDRTTVTFGYAVQDSAADFYSGIYDTVVFNSPGASLSTPRAPPNAPAFEVSGRSTTPLGLLYDSELIFGGPGGGSNAVFSDLNGSMTLGYKTGATYTSVPSAYDFGADTGETAVGIAGWWSGNTEFLNAGPSMLYGLWGAVPYLSVAAGNIPFVGTLVPSYGFLFVGNTIANLSYLPTNVNGGFETFLPPAVPPTTVYWVEGFADGYDEGGPVPFSGPNVGHTWAMTPDMGVNLAPLYMDGFSQALWADDAITGGTLGVFSNLQLDVNISFNYLNDWGYQSFNLVQVTGVDGLIFSNVTQGPDSGTQTIYVFDVPAHGATPSFLNTPGVQTKSIPGYSGVIALYDSPDAAVSNETFIGYNGSTVLTPPPSTYHPLDLGGGALILWDSDDSAVWNITVTGGSYGVYLADSWRMEVNNVSASGGSNGVSMYDSAFDPLISHISATGEYSFGVLAVYSGAIDISDVNASDLAVGVYAAPAGEVGILSVNATTGATGVVITYGSEGVYPPETSGDIYVEWVNATSGASGIVSDYSGDNFFTDVTAHDAVGLNIYADGVYSSGGDIISYLTVDDTSSETGSVISSSYATFLGNVSVNGAGTGVSLPDDIYNTIEYVWDNASSTAALSLTESNYTDLYYLNVNASGRVGVSLTDDNYFYGEYATTTGPTTYSVSGGTEIELQYGSEATVSGVTALGYGNYGIYLYEFDSSTISGASASDYSATAVLIYDSSQSTITGTGASDASRAVVLEEDSWVTVSGTTVSSFSQGVYIYEDSHNIQVTSTTVSGESIGVVVYESGLVSISGVTASNSTLSGAWNTMGWWGWPAAAVVTEYTYQVTIANVTATNYPIGLYDLGSGNGEESGPGSIYVQNLNATGGWYAIVLNDTEYGYFNDIGAYHDYVGVWMNDADYNDILGSSFVDDTNYGVSIWNGYNNWIWDSNFIGDNGATSVYSVAHIQAYSGGADTNYFYSPYSDSGNYWADWHTYDDSGNLAPYYVGDNNWDLYPLGVPAGQTEVWFDEYGLPTGTSWSVTFDGTTQSTVNTWLVFGAPAGTFAFTAGTVAGYLATPASGMVDAATGSVEVELSYAAIPPMYNVTVTEKGLPTGTSWSAIVDGMTGTSNTSTAIVSVGAGTFDYQIPAIAGYMVSPSSGSISVSGPYNISVVFTAVTYAVTLTESGLTSGKSWSTTVNGNLETSTGTSITFYLVNGTYAFSVANVSGYTVSGSSGTLKVSGAPAGVAVSFAPSTTTSFVSTDNFNSWLAVLIALAVIALVVGLLALFLRRRPEQPQTTAPSETPAAPTTESAAATTNPPAPSGAGSSSWSEGPPAGGSPPS